MTYLLEARPRQEEVEKANASNGTSPQETIQFPRVQPIRAFRGVCGNQLAATEPDPAPSRGSSSASTPATSSATSRSCKKELLPHIGGRFGHLRNRVPIHAVTAKHVIDKAKDKAKDGQVYFRLNRKDGDAEYVGMAVTEWVRHPKTSVDVAVAPFELDFSVYDHLSIPQKMFVSDPEVEVHGISPGCDLFFPGLFVHHKGTKSNIPIIRTGSIAAMPGEPIETDQGVVRAYLAEARSIGGFSGSPVFTHIGLNYTLPVHFLGLVKSHFDIEDCLDVSKQINMGIALVVPDDDILELLNSEVFDGHRKAGQEESAERRSAVSNPPPA